MREISPDPLLLPPIVESFHVTGADGVTVADVDVSVLRTTSLVP
jgi:hypothetical protein